MVKKNLLLILLSAGVVLSAFVFKINTRYRVGVDGIQYIAYTRNMLDGHGIAFSTTSIDDLAKTIFIPMQGYPPGYCLLLGTAGMMSVDLLYANALLDALGLVLFYFASLRILFYLQLSVRMQWVFALLSLFFLPPFFYGNSSDLWSAVFFQAGVAIGLYIVRFDKVHPLHFVVLSLVLFGAAFIRYAYYPLVFMVPLTLGWLAYRRKLWKLFRGVGISVVVLAGSLIALSVYQQMNTGSMVYLNQSFAIPDEQLMYFQNLEKFDPFVLKAFFDPDVLMSEVKNTWAIKLVHGFSLLVSALILFYIFYRIFFVQKSHRLADDPVWSVFHITGVLSTLVIMGLLVGLSLKDPPQVWGKWTYVEETRYYTPAMVFILIYALALVDRKTGNRTVRVITLVLLIICFAFTTGLWFSHNYKGLKRRDDKIEIYRKAKQVVQNSSVKVVYAEAGISNMYFVSISGTSPLMNLVDSEKLIMENNYEQLLQKTTLSSSEPVLLLVRTYPSIPESIRFIERFAAEKILTFPGSDIYAISIKPYGH